MQTGIERKRALLTLCNIQLLAEVNSGSKFSKFLRVPPSYLGEDSCMYVRYEAKFTVNKPQFSIHDDGGRSCFNIVHV